MTLGILAPNIKSGGGLTHLIELLNAVYPQKHGFNKVIVWSNNNTLNKLPDKKWLFKKTHPYLNKSSFHTFYWMFFISKNEAEQENCNLIFVPGGTYIGRFRPYVTMSRNMLPFEWSEASRFNSFKKKLRYLFLHFTQLYTFKRATGLIFLSNYAKDKIAPLLGKASPFLKTIPHGINNSFFIYPRHQKSVNNYSNDNPLKILYVSIINFYKHQWVISEAIAILRKKEIPVSLELIGPSYLPALNKLKTKLKELDPDENFIRYIGVIPYNELPSKYANADIGVFASSCETFGQILTEKMSAGLPIACSNRSAMPELLGNAGLYFDPENSQEIATALEKLINDPELRQKKATEAHEKAKHFTWEKCAYETFQFLSKIANQ